MDFLKNALPWLAVVLCVAGLIINVKLLKKSKKEDGEARENYMTEGMCVGMCVGLAIGAEWLSLGMVVGLAIGMLIKKQK